MRIVEVLGNFIEENSHFVGGTTLFLDYLPEDLKDGVVIRLINSSVNGMGKVRNANMVIYYITENPAEADYEIENLRKLVMGHRGIGNSKWSVLGHVEVENEGMDSSYRKVASLRFEIGYLED